MNYLITHQKDNLAKKHYHWNGISSLPIGSPFLFVIEKTKTGIRVRDLSTPHGQVVSSQTIELSDKKVLSQESKCNLSNGSVLLIKPIQKIEALYDTKEEILSQECLGFHLFQCTGQTVLNSIFVYPNKKIDIKIHQTKLFRIEVKSTEVEFHAYQDELILSQNGKKTALSRGMSLYVKTSELSGLSLFWKESFWMIRSAEGRVLLTTQVIPDVELDTFKKLLKKGFGVLGTLLLVMMLAQLLTSKPEEEEVVKEEVKTIKIPIKLAKKQASETKASSSSAAPIQNHTQRRAAISQRRAQALSSAVSGLVRGGMTQLLSQSEFLTGTSGVSQANRALHNQNGHQAGKDKIAGIGGGDAVGQVQALGGQGSGGTGSVGYGSGQKASLSGQGTGQIGLDYGESTVEEGLTKDEVGRVIYAHMNEIRYCYEASMIRNPKIEGKLLLDFTINSSGRVSQVGVKESSLGDAMLDDCIMRRLRTWPFPHPKGGVNVNVSYPFIFKTLGR